MDKIIETIPVKSIQGHWANVETFPDYRPTCISELPMFFDKNQKLDILEIGTKRISPGVPRHHKHIFRNMNVNKYITVDTTEGQDVDMVCDLYKLSSQFKDFDIIICCSVYQKCKYPHLVSHEILKCLKTGGVAFIQTHQTFPLHGSADYYRFSLDALHSLFPETMGTLILSKLYSCPCSIIPHNVINWDLYAKSFLNSNIIVKKIKETPEVFIYDI
jgi:SAM-dependent methyltransferase